MKKIILIFLTIIMMFSFVELPEKVSALGNTIAHGSVYPCWGNEDSQDDLKSVRIRIRGDGDVREKLEIGDQFSDESFEYEVIAEKEIKVIGSIINLTSLDFPESVSYRGYEYTVTSIGNNFSNDSIKNVTIPCSIKNIEKNTFSFSENLTSIDVSPNNQFYSSKDGVLYDKNQTILIKVPGGIESFSIPDTVINIEERAILQCKKLISINVSSNNQYYTSEAGLLYNKDQTKLIQVPGGINNCVISNSVVSIGDRSFMYCENLTDIIIPNNVKNIGESVFYNCINLKNITISNNVESIGNSIFDNCENLEAINVSINNPYYTSKNGVMYNKNQTELIKVPAKIIDFTIPNSVICIADSAFNCCENITHITIPENVSVIGNGVFSFCKNLKSVVVLGEITNIGNSVFSDCGSLTNITLPESVKSIDECAFVFCSSLTNLIIPNSVTNIGNEAFYECPNLILNVHKDSYAEKYAKENGLTYKIIETTIKEITSISLEKTNLSLDEGNSIKLNAMINPIDTTDNKVLTWTSSNPDIAIVDSNGKVTAINVGTATITVTTSNGKVATCTITVTSPKVSIASVTLNKTVLSLDKGSSTILNATISPNDTTDSKTLTWTSSNSNVAAVDQNGRVTAMNAGTATITVTTSNGKTATCTVTVVNPTVSITSVNLDKTSLTLNKNATATLKATINPSNTTDSKTLTWTSSNSKIATVDNQGKITAKANGTATITVKTVNGKTATCKVTVKTPVSKLTYSKVTNKTYTGKAIKPSITVKDGKKTLKNGTDYTLSYKNNKNTGKATITIKGKGNYTGSKTINFYIVPKKVTISSVKPGKKQLIVKYKKVTGASGYQIAYSTSKSKGFKYITVNAKTAFKVIKKLKSKKNYYVKVRAYKTVGKKKYYGTYSKLKSVKVK